MIITIFFTVAKDGEDRRIALSDLWSFIKLRDKELYRFLRWRSMPLMVNYLPWRLRGVIMIAIYKVLRSRLKLG
jgi:hypothetical protein